MTYTIHSSTPTTLHRIGGKYYLRRILTDDLGQTTQTLDVDPKTGWTSVKLPKRVREDILSAVRWMEWKINNHE